MKTLAAIAVLLVGATTFTRAREPLDDLFAAAANGDVAKTKQLLATNPKLATQKNAQGHTPLHSAANGRSTEVVKLLLDAGADINAKADDDHTPLYLAAVNASQDVFALLIERGADVNAVTKYDHFTPLHRAAQRGRVSHVVLLLAKGAAVDGGWKPKELKPSITPLHFAVREGQLDAARLLLAKGGTVDATPRGFGGTPLYEAVERGDPELVKLLLKKGANPNQKGPLARALQSGREELLQPFVAKGADFDSDPELLMYAAISGKTAMVERVLNAGIVLTDAENRGITALVYAVQGGHTDVVRLLLDKKVDPNIIGKAHTPPLHVAAKKEIAELLIAHKAKVDALDKEGLTPMQAAVFRGHRAVAEVIESHGAKHTLETLAALGRDIELKARLEKEPLPKPKPKSDRPTPLHLAAQFGELQTSRVLLEAGADVGATWLRGETPLHAAAKNGHVAVVALLLEHKADVNATIDEGSFTLPNPDRTTPLGMALSAGHADAVRALAKAGGKPALDGKKATALLPDLVQQKRWAVVKLLIESGAAAETKLQPVGITVFHAAAEAGELELVKWLVARKFDVNSLDGQNWTALHRATSAGQTEVVRYLLDNGAKLDDGAMFRAAANGHAALVELFLAKGANRDAVSEWFDRSTPLGHAAANGKLDVVKLLHEKGASVKKDAGILHAASLRGYRDVVAFLIEKGADVEEFRPDGFHLYYWAFQPRRLSALGFFAEKDTAKLPKGQVPSTTIEEINGTKPFHVIGGRPLQAAVAGRQKVVAALLLEKGASVKVLFPDGSTLLHLAAELDDVEMVALLLKHGAADARNQQGRTALSIAVEREDDGLAALLRKHGAKE